MTEPLRSTCNNIVSDTLQEVISLTKLKESRSKEVYINLDSYGEDIRTTGRCLDIVRHLLYNPVVVTVKEKVSPVKHKTGGRVCHGPS